jgi:hypothetical protein
MDHAAEHAKHLGRLHAALVLASAALLIAISQPPPTELNEARLSVRAIINVVSDDRWRSIWNEYVAAIDTFVAARPGRSEYPASVQVVIPGEGPVQSRLEAVTWASTWDGKLFVRGRDKSLRLEAIVPPKTLTEFRQLWEKAAEQQQVFIPDRLGERVSVELSSRGPFTSRRFDLSWAPVPAGDVARAVPTLNYNLKKVCPTLSRLPGEEITIRPRTTFLSPRFCTEGTSADLRIRMVMSVTNWHSTVPVHLQSFIAKGIDAAQITGAFASAFRSLDSVSSRYQDLQLSRVEEIVTAEMQRSPEAAEITGIRVSRQQLGVWGVLVVLILQVVFWLHLSEFVRILHAGEGVAAPWLGLFPAWSSRVVAVGSLVLPTFAIWSVHLLTGLDQGSRILRVWLLSVSCGSPLALAMTLIAITALWRRSGGPLRAASRPTAA